MTICSPTTLSQSPLLQNRSRYLPPQKRREKQCRRHRGRHQSRLPAIQEKGNQKRRVRMPPRRRQPQNQRRPQPQLRLQLHRSNSLNQDITGLRRQLGQQRDSLPPQTTTIPIHRRRLATANRTPAAPLRQSQLPRIRRKSTIRKRVFSPASTLVRS